MSNPGPAPLPSPTAGEPLNNAWAREQFPALAQQVAGRPAIFFDNPAGTQVARPVIEQMTNYLLQSNANSHGAFATSQRTDALIARARILAAAFLGAQSASEIAFGANMTTLTYALSRAIGRRFAPGDEVIVTDLDHDANISPWLELEERGILVRRIPLLRQDSTLDLDHYERLLSPKTKLVAVGYASNALGTINDLSRIAGRARSLGAWVWVDAVHYAPHGPIDVRALGIDFLVCSAYKFFGPHLGILWGRRELLEELRVQQVRPAPRSSPEKFETGTKNHEGLAGLVGAFEYLAELGGARDAARREDLAVPLAQAMRSIRTYESSLASQLLDGLGSLRGLRIHGPSTLADLDKRVPTFGFTLDGVASAEVSRQLAEQGIFSWAGNHYAMTLMERLGLEAQGGVVRVGAVHYNTPAEVERLLEVLDGIAR
jgi:cysteine desulfurase family protein (TIGR01976 family)